MQVIISGYSSSDVLTDDGIVNYARAIGLLAYIPLFYAISAYDSNCMQLHRVPRIPHWSPAICQPGRRQRLGEPNNGATRGLQRPPRRDLC